VFATVRIAYSPLCTGRAWLVQVAKVVLDPDGSASDLES
jgi:hypothetical protein